MSYCYSHLHLYLHILAGDFMIGSYYEIFFVGAIGRKISFALPIRSVDRSDRSRVIKGFLSQSLFAPLIATTNRTKLIPRV